MKIQARCVTQLLFATMSLSGCAAALAATTEEPIATDRPDFVESARSVGKGRLQIETSIARERDADAGVKTTTFTTPTLIRFGVAPAWELRVESEGYTRQRTRDSNAFTSDQQTGSSDTSIGAKWAMQDGEGAVPAIGWLLHAELPSGSKAFRGEGVRPSLRAVFEWELPADFSLGVMPGVVYDKSGGDRFAAGILAVVVGREWTDRFRTFVEVAGRSIKSSAHGGSVVTYDVGGAYLLSKNVQIDTAVSWGANRYTPDFAWTVGLSMRF
jgi:hypothetical protein